ncbi:MAG: prepilin-type N-terminal cleavage/methylation domain-containing protein [Nitrospirales bacterium]|nr:prepilin-type N-terminal cleavage/methylation domain-containing protein [Nitrospira sp.]MDR4501271.1 prepilin-type N-terminal cleavage/methylation domain-containing protein [Nitrospirales bacterium]
MKTINEQGFTLVEVMVALALSVLTVGATYTIYARQVQSQIVRDEQLDMQQHARVAMDLLTREVHMAGYDPRHVNRDQLLTNDFDGIVYDPSMLVVRADLNGNGVPTDTNEFIQFSHDPRTMTLRRNTGGGRQLLAEHIQGFAVQYFNRHGQETTVS